MSELPVDEMAPYAPQYDEIATKYWWEVQLVLIHQPRQYQQPRHRECCMPGPPTALAPRELMKEDRDLKISEEMPCSSAKRMKAYWGSPDKEPQSINSSQDAIANCLCCPCWNCDYTLRTTHSRENSLHKRRIENELKLRQFSIKIVIKFIKSCKFVD